MAKTLGIGGVFFRADDPQSLAEWYATWLGFALQSGSAATFDPQLMPDGGFTVWGAFDRNSEYFAPGKQSYMINLVVDDLDGALRQVKEGGAIVTEDIREHEYGLFGWFVDPQGNKVELWEPRAPE